MVGVSLVRKGGAAKSKRKYAKKKFWFSQDKE